MTTNNQKQLFLLCQLKNFSIPILCITLSFVNTFLFFIKFSTFGVTRRILPNEEGHEIIVIKSNLLIYAHGKRLKIFLQFKSGCLLTLYSIQNFE